MTQKNQRARSANRKQEPSWGRVYRVTSAVFFAIAALGCYTLYGTMGPGSEGVIGTMVALCGAASLLGVGAGDLADCTAAVYWLTQDMERMEQSLKNGTAYHAVNKPVQWRSVIPRVRSRRTGSMGAGLALIAGILTIVLAMSSFEALFDPNFNSDAYTMLMTSMPCLVIMLSIVMDNMVRSASQSFKHLEDRLTGMKNLQIKPQLSPAAAKPQAPKANPLEIKVKQLQSINQDNEAYIEHLQAQLAQLRAEVAQLKAEAAKPKPAPKKRPGTGTAASPGEGTGASI